MSPRFMSSRSSEPGSPRHGPWSVASSMDVRGTPRLRSTRRGPACNAPAWADERFVFAVVPISDLGVLQSGHNREVTTPYRRAPPTSPVRRSLCVPYQGACREHPLCTGHASVVTSRPRGPCCLVLLTALFAVLTVLAGCTAAPPTATPSAPAPPPAAPW